MQKKRVSGRFVGLVYIACATLGFVSVEVAIDPSEVAAQRYRSGQPIEVLWNSSWYPATILAVNPNGTYRIHYDGWADSWDEDVAPDRMRPRNGATTPPPPPPPGPPPGQPPSSPPPSGSPSSNPGSTNDPGGTPVTSRTPLSPGQPVQVLWNGRWYNATILALAGRNVRVHYDGWDTSWDENVQRSRIRVGGVIR